MDAAALRAFLAAPHEAIIATNRVGQGAQLSPVWFIWDGTAFLFGTQTASVKYANIVRDPHIAVIVNDPGTHTYVTAWGRAEVVAREQYPELGNAIVAKYIPAAQREQFAAVNQDIERAARVVIVLKPQKVVGWTWTAL